MDQLVDETVASTWSTRLYWTLLAVVAVAEVAPLFIVKYLPLVDLPNHEARVAILAHYGADPTMRKYYVVDWRPIPDMAFDLFGVPLVRLGMASVDAARFFLAIAALLYVIGGHLLAKVGARRRSWVGVVLPFVFYNSMLFYGFLDFVFGFGVFLVTYALWLRWRAEMKFSQVLVVSGLTLVAFLSHLTAFGFISAAIAVTVIVDLALGKATRRASRRSIMALAPSLLLLAYSAETRGSNGGLVWGSLKEKAIALGGMFLSYDYKLDAIWIGGIIIVVLIAVASSRSVTVESSVAAVAVVFALLFLILPYSLITATDVDSRLVPAAAVLSLCAIRLSLATRVAAILTVCVALFAGSRVAYITAQWMHISDRIARQVQLLDTALPRNANVYSLFPEGAAQIDKRERPYAHLASYATMDRNAHVSRTFASRSQQPLISRVDEIAAINAVAPYTVNYATLRQYSYVWTYQPGLLLRRQLRGRCVTIYNQDGFYLCRIIASGS